MPQFVPFMRRFARLVPVGLAAAIAYSGVTPAEARTQQAPSSRVTIDLPEGYEPASLFSGFTHERLGVSFVVVEMPGKAYEELEAGMTPEALAAKGVRNARRLKLERAEPHVYMQAEQTSAAGDYAKFFVVFRDSAVTALITANVQKASLEKGDVKSADIERALASARVAETAAPAKDLFKLGYLGAFKPAGVFLGTARVYTLDGQSAPAERSVGRPMVIVTPSLDRRVVPRPEEYADGLIASLAGTTDTRVTERRRMTIAGLEGVELVATAKDRDGGAEIALYQALLLAKGGGYFRIVGQTGAADRERHLAEFRRIAASFEPLP